jgi:hypothetical protein
MAIIQDKRTELSENFTCNTVDEVHDILQEFIDDRRVPDDWNSTDEIDWDLQVQFLKDSKLWLVVARASVIEGDIQYG